MATSAEKIPQSSVPAYKLFDANAVVVAAFFGTPVMGSALIALNYSLPPVETARNERDEP